MASTDSEQQARNEIHKVSTPCWHYLRTKKCPYGIKCLYTHSEGPMSTGETSDGERGRSLSRDRERNTRREQPDEKNLENRLRERTRMDKHKKDRSSDRGRRPEPEKRERDRSSDRGRRTKSERKEKNIRRDKSKERRPDN